MAGFDGEWGLNVLVSGGQSGAQLSLLWGVECVFSVDAMQITAVLEIEEQHLIMQAMACSIHREYNMMYIHLFPEDPCMVYIPTTYNHKNQPWKCR